MTLALGEVPLMLSLRLFLPENWTNDTARKNKAGVPAAFQEYRTKPEIAMESWSTNAGFLDMFCAPLRSPRNAAPMAKSGKHSLWKRLVPASLP